MRRFNCFSKGCLRGLFYATFCLLLAMPAASAYAAAGDLDPTFGDGGKVMIDFGSEDIATAVVRQLDGKLVVAGWTRINGIRDIVLIRYNPDGSLDTSFDGDGKVLTNFDDEYAFDLLLQPDGKLVAIGGSRMDMELVRYNTNGSLDSTFGIGGRVLTDYGGEDRAYSGILQPDGKLVVSGWGNTGSGINMSVARYNANGSPDITFDGDGKTLIDVEAIDIAFDLILQPDGKIVVAGGARWGAPEYDPIDIALARLNSDGSLDPSFGVGGIVHTDFGRAEWIFELFLQPDGKIVGAGTGGSQDFLLIRYNADGSLDTTFGSGGKTITDFGFTEQGTSVVRQGNGKFVVGGWSGTGSYDSADYDFALARYNADGSLDTTFGSNGKVISDFGGHAQSFGLLIQPDGKYVMSGRIKETVAVARYLGDGAGLATIRIVQDAIPDNTRNYVYDSAFGSFRLDDTGSLPDDKDGVPNSISFNVAPGSYGFSQQMVTGWRVSDIRCDPSALATVSMPNRSVTVNVKSGDNVTCTFVTKQAVTVYARAYWDKNGNRIYDVSEPWKSGVWTEILDGAGKRVAANFTDNNGQVGAFNLAPGAYSVCQTPPSGWWNTQPAKLDPRYNKPCYSFNVAPAGLVTGYFGWIDRPFSASAKGDAPVTSGLEITVFETLEEEPATDKQSLYLPMIAR